MKTMIQLFCLIFVGSILFSGCATTQLDLVTNNWVSVETNEGRNHRFSTVHIYQKKDRTFITGSINHKGHSGGMEYGHIDITILNPDGSVFKKAVAKTRHQHSKFGDRRPSTFRKRLPVIVPKNSIIQVNYHSGNITLKCTDL